MGACCSSDLGPAEIPPSASLPPGLEILDPKDKESVQQAIEVCARSFAGTSTSEPPGEFNWMLADVPDRADPSQQQERVHRLYACLGYCVHYAFTLGRRGLVLVTRSGTAEKASGSGNITGCVVLGFYPKKWSPSIDGVCASTKAGVSCGASKWTKAQNQFMNSKKMGALEKALQKLHSAHASTPHIYVQVAAVDPEAQGAGVGSKMMRAVNTIADALNLPCFLECDAGKNEAVYKRFGYTTVGKEELSVTQKGEAPEVFSGGMCAMRREPGRSSESEPPRIVPN